MDLDGSRRRFLVGLPVLPLASTVQALEAAKRSLASGQVVSTEGM